MASMTITPEARAAIIGLVREGNDRVVAARAHGVTEQDLDTWASEAAQGEPRARMFFQELEQAEAMAEAMAVQQIYQSGMSGNSKAALQWLERARKSRWKPPERAPLIAANLDLSRLTPAELEEKRARYLAELAAAPVNDPGKKEDT
jgi:hypothetical protein